MTPRPFWSVWIRSLMSSAGSPKSFSPACCSRPSRLRWMAPTLAAEMLPYCVLNCAWLSPAYCSIARRSLRSRSSIPLSSAILKTIWSTPSCVSLRLSIRASSSGPISDTVVRMGWPPSPSMSQNTTGEPSNA